MAKASLACSSLVSLSDKRSVDTDELPSNVKYLKLRQLVESENKAVGKSKEMHLSLVRYSHVRTNYLTEEHL